jgi:hypothetical protein
VRKKNLTSIFRPGKSTAGIHSGAVAAEHSGPAEPRTRAAPGCYHSMMCSTEDAALRRVAEAIDRLEADLRTAGAADLEARVAAIWSMVSDIDPGLARLVSGYRDLRRRVRPPGGDERSAD